MGYGPAISGMCSYQERHSMVECVSMQAKQGNSCKCNTGFCTATLQKPMSEDFFVPAAAYTLTSAEKLYR